MFSWILEMLFPKKDIVYDYDEYLSNGLKFIVDDYKQTPCAGSLELGDHCSGCWFEEEHTGKSKSGRAK